VNSPFTQLFYKEILFKLQNRIVSRPLSDGDSFNRKTHNYRMHLIVEAAYSIGQIATRRWPR